MAQAQINKGCSRVVRSASSNSERTASPALLGWWTHERRAAQEKHEGVEDEGGGGAREGEKHTGKWPTLASARALRNS